MIPKHTKKERLDVSLSFCIGNGRNAGDGVPYGV